MAIKTLLTILLITTVSITGIQHTISTDGVDNIKIGKATLNDVKKVFPNGKKVLNVSKKKKTTTWVKWIDGTCSMFVNNKSKVTTTDYIVKSEGISFYFPYNDTLSNIAIWGKDKFITDKGIVLGKSTFHDLDSIYGTKEWSYTSSIFAKATVWTKSYKNIYFNSTDTAKAKRTDKLIIDHIIIRQY